MASNAHPTVATKALKIITSYGRRAIIWVCRAVVKIVSPQESAYQAKKTREQEDALIEKALDRIHRAQSEGRETVKLRPNELVALETRRIRLQAEAAVKQKSAEIAGRGNGIEGQKKRRTNIG